MHPSIERFLGYTLQSIRAGDKKLLSNDIRFKSIPTTIQLTSPEFNHDDAMPLISSADGENRSPALDINDVPTNAKSLLLVIQDIDPPLPSPIVHLIAYGIDPETANIPEDLFKQPEAGYDASSKSFKFGSGFGATIGYRGPRPVRKHGAHRYVFQIFAIDAEGTEKLNKLEQPHPYLETIADNIEGHVIDKGLLTGTYERF